MTDIDLSARAADLLAPMHFEDREEYQLAKARTKRALAAARDAALEEAAKTAEETVRALLLDDNPRRACSAVAARIRAMMWHLP